MKRTLIIAEAGVNHNGDIKIAKQLIDVAAGAGADYVKFQTFKAERLVSKAAHKADYQIANTGGDSDTQFEMIRKLELDRSAHEVLIDHCRKAGIKFLSTAFDEESVDLLDQLNIDLYKIPSGEITNLPLLRKVATKGKPVIVSTGMSTMDEIRACVQVLMDGGISKEQLTILHCNTEYPTPFQDVHLRAMSTMANELSLQTGYSDHTIGIEVPIAAVALGAVCIEKHFTLDRTMPGPDHKASLEPAELTAMVSAIRNIELALGSAAKQPSPSELKNKVIARKSIHLGRSLKKGNVITAADLQMVRPGDGISPFQIDTIVGRIAADDLPAGHKLTHKDLQ